MNTEILANLIINKFNFVSTMYTEKNTRIKRQNRPCWGIVIKYEGETEYYVKNERYISNINNAVILPKGCSYDWICTKSGHFVIIEFESDAKYDDIFTFPLKDGEKILQMFRRLEYRRGLKKTEQELESIRDCYSIILDLIKESKKEYLSSEKQKKLSPAIEYIAKYYNTNIKNDDLSEVTGLSTPHFRKVFKDVYGVSPISYVNELRMKKACEMLKSDFGSIGDIAYSLGFLNIYEFSRAFKKYMGISPSEYIKTVAL